MDAKSRSGANAETTKKSKTATMKTAVTAPGPSWLSLDDMCFDVEECCLCCCTHDDDDDDASWGFGARELWRCNGVLFSDTIALREETIGANPSVILPAMANAAA